MPAPIESVNELSETVELSCSTTAESLEHFESCLIAGDRAQRRHGGARLGLLAWGRRYLTAHFTRPPSAMHRWLARQLAATRDARGRKFNCLGPRGSAKSTIATLAFPLRAALEGRERYIWIVSDTKHQARAHLENLRAELDENQSLQEAYPDAFGPKLRSRAGHIVLANGATLEAYGTGQRLRGRRRGALRPTLIICDDLQNDGHTNSALQRERSLSWFDGTLMKAGTARTNIVNLATALHHDAIALVLLRRPGWTSRVFRAIQRWPKDMALWQQWEALYANPEDPAAVETARAFFDEHQAAMLSGARVLWPEEEDLYTLMRMRAEHGRTAFEREKQNSPINPEACEWPEAYFAEPLWFDEWPRGLVAKTLALDPSKGSDARRGDYSALVLLGVDRQGMLYVEADLRRRPTPEIVADGVEWFRRFRPDVFGIEANQFQELLAGEFEAEFRRQGLLAARPWPIENHTNKLVRIRRLGAFLAGRRLRFKHDSPGTRLLVEQLRQFPLADHDDGPDALEMAVRLASELLSARSGDEVVGTLRT